MVTTLTEEPADTKAATPRHEYRAVTPRRGHRKKLCLDALTPQPSSLPMQTAAVFRTKEGTLKGSGRTQGASSFRDGGGTSIFSEEAGLMTLQDQGELVATICVSAEVPAGDLIARIIKQTQVGQMSAEEATDLLFPFLFDGTIHNRRQVFATLRKVATPEAILETALRNYRLQGYEGYLGEAASLLASFGAVAWTTIRKWAKLGGAECESLVETAFCIQGVPEPEYLAGLKDLVSLGDQNTRSCMLGALYLLPLPIQKELLSLMARTGDSDDPTRNEAQERLAEDVA